MSDMTEMETFYGKHNKYTVVKKPGTGITSSTYYVKVSNGDTKGSWDSLSKAVEWAKEQAEKH